MSRERLPVMLTNRLKAQLVILTTFVLGVIIGASGQYLIARQSAPKPPPTTKEAVEELSRVIKLDESQQTRIEQILNDTKARYQELRVQLRPQYNSVRDESRRRIRELLSPEQQNLYDQLNREQDAKREQKAKEEASKK